MEFVKELFKDEALLCDGECTKLYHCICVGMSSEQYQILHQDYDRDNALQWLCDSCKDQNIEIARSEISTTWGKMKNKENQKKSQFGISKNYRMDKNYMQIPRGKAGKTLTAEVSRLAGLFNGSKRWEPVAIHMIQVFLSLLLQKPSLKSENGEHVKSKSF